MSRALLFVACLATPTAAAAQALHGPGMQAGAFLDRARAGTERYHDVNVALADGYRPLGPDAPAMGVHWVNPSIALAGQVDAARPAILTYISVAGRHVLVGTGYVVPLAADEEPPDEPAGRHAWHFHSRSVIDESVAPGRHTPAAMHEGFRVAVLHAWGWQENPAGAFAPENWALPYRRIGLPVPPGAPVPAAQALALATDEGADYYADRLRLLNADEIDGALSVLDEYDERVRAWLAARSRSPLSDREVAWLAELWNELGNKLRRTHPGWERAGMD